MVKLRCSLVSSQKAVNLLTFGNQIFFIYIIFFLSVSLCKSLSVYSGCKLVVGLTNINSAF